MAMSSQLNPSRQPIQHPPTRSRWPPSTLGNSIITNSNLGDTASPIASNGGLTATQGSPESYASFERHSSASCSTSPPADHDATSIMGENDGDMTWMHGLGTSSPYAENEPMDINYAQESASARRFSLSCASDAETIVTASQPKANLSWYNGQYTSAVPNSSSNYTADVQQAQFLTTSQSMPTLPETGRAAASARFAQHARKRTHDSIDYAQENTASAHVALSGKNIKRSRGRLSQDMGYLVHTLAQDPAELQAQLSNGQRPAVFDHIYRAQLAQSMAQNQTVSRFPGPAASNAPGSPAEDPMMPPMQAMERMQPIQPVQTVQTTPGLLSYNFPVAMPNIHDTQHSSSSAAAFFAVNNTADGSVLDLSDPAMLDRYLGLASDNTEAVDSHFNWPRS
ncbi:Mat1-1-1 [Ophiostoma piceae UAMH 11346]|uniref:Mat1-1-1 n=1 Tax=Ophiostoma piceae (strain UAMH 11346) TaxID=1262450 RepID=S3BTG5_OPHP1|nr:Mat1-1-1 [Ophiostoma piceae UAMH 11346]